MKRSWKNALIAAGALVVLGAALCAAALSMVDFDLRRLSTDYGEELAVETAQYDPAALTEIVADLSVEDLRLEPSEDGLVHFRYTQRTRRPYTLEQRGGTLYITQEQQGWLWLTFDFGWGSDEAAAVLSLPADFAGALTLHSDVGDIEADALRLAGPLTADTDTGSIDLRGLAAPSLRLTVDTGSIRGRDWAVSGDVHLESHTGDIHLEDCAAAGAASCESDVGAMDLVRLSAASISLESATGDVTLEALSAPQITVSSDVGSVTGTIDGAEADYTIDAEADVGDCNLRVRAGRTDRRLTVRTGTGDIDLRFTKE